MASTASPVSADTFRLGVTVQAGCWHANAVCLVLLFFFSRSLTFSLSLSLSGVGLLSIPYALSEGGWLSLALLLLVAAVCCYTGLLLQRCMDASPAVRGYPDIGALAFGRGGRLAASAFLYAELYLVAIGFLILEGDNLDKLFPGTSLSLGLRGAALVVSGKQLFVVLVALVILPTTWLRSLGVLAYVSASGVLASAVVVVCVLWTALADGVGFRARGRMLNVSGLPTALGLYTFCYCGHAIFPTLCISMKEKKRFSRVSRCALFIEE